MPSNTEKNNSLWLAVTCGLLVSLWCEPTLAAVRQFHYTRKLGKIWVMPPLGMSWEPLRKAQVLEEGTLLRLDPGSTIELKQTASDLSVAESKARLSIKEPVIVRLDRQIFKKLRYEEYAIDGIWTTGPSDEKEVTAAPLLSFGAAYVRHMLALKTPQELPPLKSDPQREAIEAGEALGSINMLAPQAGSLWILDEARVKIQLAWESPKAGLRFKIFLWPASDIKRDALATVAGQDYRLTITEPGRYKVQVVSEDFRYRSPVLPLTVDTPLVTLKRNDPLQKEQDQAQRTISSTLSWVYPLPQMDIQASGTETSCLFVWKDARPIEAGDTYTLFVQRLDKEGAWKVQGDSKGTASLRLPLGRFQYYLIKQNSIVTRATLASPSQVLTIRSGTQPRDWRAFGASLKDRNEPRILMVQ